MRVIDIIKPLYEFAPPTDADSSVELLRTLADMVLKGQLEGELKKEATNIIVKVEKTARHIEAAQPAQPVQEPIQEPIQEPEDWSDELTAVELELQRLGWDRHQEGIYLERAFALASRNRLVNYADLVIYLKALRTLEPPCSAATAAIPLLRAAMLKASDQLLGQLQWGAEEGRAFLVEHFGHSSRLQLSDDQLQQFNGLLQKQLQQEPINFVAPQTA